MVKVDVICMVTRAGCGRPVARGWLTGVWVVEPYVGGGCKVVVGEWCDVFGGSVKPCACADTAGGVMNPHGSGVEGVGAGCCVEVPDECCEAFLLVFSMLVSGVISLMVDQSVGSTLLVAVWSCALVLGRWLRRSPMVVWPVCVRMAGATCCQLATSAVSLIWSEDVKPKPPLVDGCEQLYVVLCGEVPVQPLFV